MDQRRRGVLEPDIGCDPLVGHGGLDLSDGGSDQRADRRRDRFKACRVPFLLLLQDHVRIGAGKQSGQKGDDEEGHTDHRKQHVQPE